MFSDRQPPARGECLRSCLGDELSNNLGARLLEVLGQTLQLLPRRPIKPQHETLAVRPRVMGAASWDPSSRSLPRTPTGRKIHGCDLAQHVAQPGSSIPAFRRLPEERRYAVVPRSGLSSTPDLQKLHIAGCLNRETRTFP